MVTFGEIGEKSVVKEIVCNKKQTCLGFGSPLSYKFKGVKTTSQRYFYGDP